MFRGEVILKRLITLIICTLVWNSAFFVPVYAQGENLLQNPGFDGGLSASPNGSVPTGWAIYGDASSDKESLPALTRSAPYSWRLRKEYGVFTGGGYQSLDVQAGATYRFSIYAMIWTCDDPVHACRNETSTFSDTSSGGRVRIGIDPTGGTNPYAATVQWGGFRSPFTWGVFEYLSLDTVATSGRMTVFTYYTADKVMRFHDVFWDDASLVQVSQAPANPGNGENPAPNPQPRNTAVPVVADPVERADGALVHIVQSGQSLWTIAQGYGLSLVALRDLNGLYDSDVIYQGQELIVQAPPQSQTLPTASPSPTATITQIPFSNASPTIIAQNNPTQEAAPTRTITAVRLDNSSDSEESNLRGGVVALAVSVVIIGLGTIGGILYLLAQSLFPRGPQL